MRRAGCLCTLPVRRSGGRHGSRGWDWFQKALDEREKPSTKPHILHYQPLKDTHKRPRAYMNFRSEEEDLGKIVFELADDVAPKSVQNFVMLCTGENEHNYTYKKSSIHFVKKDFIIQAGDVTGNNGESGHAAFSSRYFDDENYILQHGERGILSLANSGVHRNNSQFFITLAPQKQLDGRAVSIGRVVEGLDVLEKLENLFTVDMKPLSPVLVEDCGIIG